MVLYSDSSFVKRGCANEIKGKWDRIGDSLVLFLETNRFINKKNLPDTTFPKPMNKVHKYVIRENYCHNITVLNEEKVLMAFNTNVNW